MRPIRLDLARAQWSDNGSGRVVIVRRNGRKMGYYLPEQFDSQIRASAARAIRECRERLA